jgi:hypothetical protein
MTASSGRLPLVSSKEIIRVTSVRLTNRTPTFNYFKIKSLGMFDYQDRFENEI